MKEVVLYFEKHNQFFVVKAQLGKGVNKKSIGKKAYFAVLDKNGKEVKTIREHALIYLGEL